MPIIGFMYLSMVREDQIIEFKGQFDTQNFVYMPFPVTDHTNDVMSDY